MSAEGVTDDTAELGAGEFLRRVKKAEPNITPQVLRTLPTPQLPDISLEP
jgi:hypothetical protein